MNETPIFIEIMQLNSLNVSPPNRFTLRIYVLPLWTRVDMGLKVTQYPLTTRYSVSSSAGRLTFFRWISHDVMANMLDYEIEVSEFELHSRFFFQTDTLWKSMNPLTPLTMVKSSSSSSSCRAAIPDPLSPLFPIIYRLWQVFRATPRILT